MSPYNCQKGQNVPIGLNESECVSVSPRACQRMVRIEKFCYMIEIGDTAVNIVRNCIPMRNCMQGSAYGLKAISDWFLRVSTAVMPL